MLSMVPETSLTELYLGLDVVNGVRDPPQLRCILALTLPMVPETLSTQVYLGLDVDGARDPFNLGVSLP